MLGHVATHLGFVTYYKLVWGGGGGGGGGGNKG